MANDLWRAVVPLALPTPLDVERYKSAELELLSSELYARRDIAAVACTCKDLKTMDRRRIQESSKTILRNLPWLVALYKEKQQQYRRRVLEEFFG